MEVNSWLLASKRLIGTSLVNESLLCVIQPVFIASLKGERYTDWGSLHWSLYSSIRKTDFPFFSKLLYFTYISSSFQLKISLASSAWPHAHSCALMHCLYALWRLLASSTWPHSPQCCFTTNYCNFIFIIFFIISLYNFSFFIYVLLLLILLIIM